MKLAKIPPALVALLLQISAIIITVFVLHALQLSSHLVALAFYSGIVAACLSYLARQAWWWQLIHVMFLPTVVMVNNWSLNPVWYLAIFAILLLIYWSTFRSQVPLYLSSKKIHQALAGFIPADKDFTFIDLGCGLGGVLAYLCHKHPRGKYEGVELAPLPFLWSWLRMHLGRYKNCRVIHGSFWGCDLAEYDIVFAYLSPAPMEQLWHKAKSEMRPGSVLISSTFAIPGKKPDHIIKTDDLHHSQLLIWRM